MRIEKPLYIIRSSEYGALSGAMTHEKVIKAALSGHWGEVCLIDEVYDFRLDFPAVLRRVAVYAKNSGFIMVETDEEYHRFLMNMGVDEPESPALNELREIFLSASL